MATSDHIIIDPQIMAGQPVIKGTRITVALILRELGRGATPAEIIDQYPHLKIEDIRAATNLAADVVSMERNESDLQWSELAAGSAVDELLVAKILAPKDADWARKIVAQQLHVLLVSGLRPTSSLPTDCKA